MPSISPGTHALLDEVLIRTVIQKEWDYKRIASYAIEKQVEVLKELQKKFDHPDINSLIQTLENNFEEIGQIKV